MGATRMQPLTIDGVDYPSKKAAIFALFEQGEEKPRIVELTGSTLNSVNVALRGKSRGARKVKDPATLKDAWTPEKRDKARKLFGKTMIYIAEAINVPPREFLSYVLHGIIPPSQEIADPDDIRWRDGQAEPARALKALPPVEAPPAHAFEPVEGEGEDAIDADHMVTPSRDDDEAELAAMDAADGDQVEATVPVEAPAVPARRFPDPPPAAPAGKATGVAAPGQVMCLMDEMGRYLHESLDGLTTNPRFAWKGGADKVKIVQARLPHLRQLDVVAYTR